MRKLFFAKIFFLLSLYASAQNVNHPTVSNLVVQYKSLPQSTLSVSQSTNALIKVVPMATITLVDANLLSGINFKVINSTGAIEYESNFAKSANTITDASGRKIFQISGNSVLINVPRELISGTYLYHVTTKNNSNVASSTYTLTY